MRHYILYEFQKGNNVSDATENLCRMFEADPINSPVSSFTKFKNGEFSLKDEHYSVWPSKIEDCFASKIEFGKIFNVLI